MKNSKLLIICIIVIIVSLLLYVFYGNKYEFFQSTKKAMKKSKCAQFIENAENGKYDKQYLRCYEDCIYTKPNSDASIYCGNGSECDAFCDDVTAVN